MTEKKSKETVIYEFSTGKIDILPVEYFPDFLSIVNSMAQNKLRYARDTQILGLPMPKIAQLSRDAEAYIKADEYTKAGLKIREIYTLLNF